MQFTLTIYLAAVAALTSAYTPADVSQPPSGNSIGHPELGELIPAGETYTITWSPDTGDHVTLFLLRGPSTNVVPILTIVEAIPNTGFYVWSPVPTDLEPDTTGYGIQLIVEGSGAYQYSPQFGVRNDGYIGSMSSTSSGAATTTASPNDESYSYISSDSASTLTSGSIASSTLTSSMNYVHYATGAPSAANGTGSVNFSVPVLNSTESIAVPTTLQSTSSNNATVTTRTGNSSTAATAPVMATGRATANNALLALNAAALAAAGSVAGMLAF